MLMQVVDNSKIFVVIKYVIMRNSYPVIQQYCVICRQCKVKMIKNIQL